MDTDARLTIDELAAASATTTRRIRSLQTLGLLPHPDLQGRTGLYGPDHRDRLAAVRRLQAAGFSLASIGVLFRALDAGQTLSAVLGLAEPAAKSPRAQPGADGGADSAELYGFSELQPAPPAHGQVQPLLSLVPTTVWDESRAS